MSLALGSRPARVTHCCFEHAGQIFRFPDRDPQATRLVDRVRKRRRVMRQRPREIPDSDHEVVIERVCAIDVAKASGAVCVRLPHASQPGRRVSRVWDVPATTRAVTDLGAQLVAQGIGKVTVESTSDYWRIWFYL